MTKNKHNNKPATPELQPDLPLHIRVPQVPEGAPSGTPEGSFEVVDNTPPVSGLKGLSRENRKPSGKEPVARSSASLLPPGGLVTMRRSGGLRFTSETITVFTSGDVESGQQKLGRLDDKALSELYRVLEAIEWPPDDNSQGRQNPDAYAYEIQAQLGHERYSLEALSGRIPTGISPLITLLLSYLNPSH